jgi:hypothetical protein
MSQRTLLLTLACLVLGAGIFAYLMVAGSSEKPLEPLPNVTEKPEIHHRRTLPHTQSNRFTSLIDSSIRWQVKVDQLRRLDGSTLNPTEVDYLYKLLREKPQGSGKEAWWVVVNEVMEQIVKQNIASERISSEFCSMIDDKNLDNVVRDYAVQHISNYIAYDATSDADTHVEVFQALKKVIQDPTNQHNSIPGTTLMSLVVMSENPSQTSVVKACFKQLDNYLRHLLEGESSASVVTRTSAINVVGLMQIEQYSPVLTQIINSTTANDSAKLSAVASLGDMYAGCSAETESYFDTLEVLTELANGSSKFKYAASSALKKLP